MDTPIAALKAPRINTVWPGQGGIYAGIARGIDGAPDCHVIVALEQPTEEFTWKDRLKAVKSITVDGHSDFTVATRFQAALVYANANDRFDPARWYWTSSEYSERDAWIQDFDDGGQYDDGKSCKARAVAVRLIPIDA